MRILACVRHSYYGDPVAVNQNYYNFVEQPRRLGHEVVHFDYEEHALVDKDSMNDLYISLLRGGRFDLVLTETRLDEFYPEVLDQAKDLAITVGFNSDDDFRWLDHSSRYVEHYSFMVTTYRHVYEAVRADHPNVLLSQWACSGDYEGLRTRKDLGVAFVGGIHASRAARIRELRSRIPVEVRGYGAGLVDATARQLAEAGLAMACRRANGRKQVKRWLMNRARLQSFGISYEEANLLWSRSKVSFTPLDLAAHQEAQKLEMARQMGHGDEPGSSSPWTSKMQIKSRVFEMGMSGTLMLCDHNPALDEFYQRGKEYEDFESLEECVSKARYYLANESAREKMCRAYHDRTLKEHLWKRRLEELLANVAAAV